MSVTLDEESAALAMRRLRRAYGQLGGVIKMLEEGRECQDIVTQISAVSSALNRAGFTIVAAGLKQCVSDPEKSLDQEQLEKLFLSLA